MAEPILTSSDIIRERMGFGVSPMASEETRRAYAAAGLSPLSTQARQRFEEGRGLSPMASQQEQEAWRAQEVRAKRRPETDLPMAYGGIGERPEATTRRGLRMQQEWDKRYEMMIAQQEAARQIEERDREYALRLQDQQNQMEDRNIARDAALAKVSREAEIKNQSKRIREAFLGASLPDGSKTRPIDLNSNDAVERIQRTVYMNDLGMEDQATKEMASMFLDDALRLREKRATEFAEQEKAATEARVGLAKDLAQNGLSIVDFSKDGKVNFEAANIALGEALKKRGEAEEERKDEREQMRDLRRQKATAETELVKIKAQVGRFEKLRPTANNLTELEAARVSQGIFEDEINRINRELGEEAQTSATPTGQRPTARDIFGD